MYVAIVSGVITAVILALAAGGLLYYKDKMIRGFWAESKEYLPMLKETVTEYRDRVNFKAKRFNLSIEDQAELHYSPMGITRQIGLRLLDVEQDAVVLMDLENLPYRPSQEVTVGEEGGIVDWPKERYKLPGNREVHGRGELATFDVLAGSAQIIRVYAENINNTRESATIVIETYWGQLHEGTD